MKLGKFEIIDRCLFWEEEKILVVGDLHLGYEDALHERGWSFPKTQIEETLELFEKILKKVGKVKKIILLGDVKHYFAGILQEEWRDFRKILKLFEKNLYKSGKVILTKGNHDVLVGSMLKVFEKKFGFLKIVDYYKEDDVLFFHGGRKSFDSLGLDCFDKKVKLIVVGHFHTAVVISEDEKKEKYKCFLFGNWKGKKIIFVPSFFPLVEGKNILDRTKPGFMEGIDVRKFEVYILSGKFGEVLDWGKVSNLM